MEDESQEDRGERCVCEGLSLEEVALRVPPFPPPSKNEGRGLLPLTPVTVRRAPMGLALRHVRSVLCTRGPPRAGAGA